MALAEYATAILVENNIFYELRHSMIVQVGVNGSVFGYNYAEKNYSDDGWDKIAISLHGHYSFMNLLEGNIVGSASIGDYWGPDGPGNTYFRNRIMGTDKHQDFGDYRGIMLRHFDGDQNILGNEILGIDGVYFISDTNSDWSHVVNHGNNVRGDISWDASFPDTLPASLYLSSKPGFFGDMSWPPIGPDKILGQERIPALTRWEDFDFIPHPSAVISADPNQGQAPLEVYFDGASSYDPDGAIISYEWDFGDSSAGSGETISHIYEFAGTYVAALTVTDNEGATDEATVVITVDNESNNPPEAEDQSVATNEDTPIAITLVAIDEDGDQLTYTTVAAPANGILTGTFPSVTYTPESGFTGTDSFTFKANDGQDDSNIATVSITVNRDNLEIRLTYIPDYGTQHDLLRGKVEGTTIPTEYKIAVYILIDGMGWYIKPYVDTFVFPDFDGNWTCDIVTGGVDQYAVKIIAYLLPGDYNPTQRSREGDEENAIDKVTATRTANIISFSGYNWAVKSSVEGINSWQADPGKNYFSASSENVWVDEKGYLHLKIKKRDGKWYCAEVKCLEEFGYGTYNFSLSSGFEQMINQNENVVLGLFMYDDEAPPPCREITIEYSRWGDPEADNGQFVVQPHETPGNKQRFNFPCTGQDSKHSFKWSKDEIGFEASYIESITESWTYTGNDIPDHGDITVRINLWLFDKEGLGEQSEASEVEVIIERFEFGVSFPIPAGWSMISLPLKPETDTVATLFPGSVVVYGFEKAFGYVRKQKLEVGKGYWILMNEAQSYTLTGQPIESYNISIDSEGWLMIGGCTEPASALMNPCNIVVIYKFTKESGYQRILESECLEPSKGYWILLNNLNAGTTFSVETFD